MTATVLDALEASLDRCRQYAKASAEPPLAVFWLDPESQWEPVLPLLRARTPRLLTVGPRDPEARVGPAIWVRVAMAEAARDPRGAATVVYLPGVSREVFRAVEDCPVALAPLAGLQFRGRLWLQPNGREWTPRAFLSAAAEGTGLTLADDAETREATRLALRRLVETELASLRGKTLNADALRRLLVEDPVGEFLEWLEDPAAFRARADDARWAALRGVFKSGYGLDLEKDGPTVAAARVCASEKKWSGVFKRVAQRPTLALVERLSAVVPPAQLGLDDRERYPAVNAALEGELRADLEALAALDPEAARRRVLALEERHGVRRGWPWAATRPSRAPLAQALDGLARVARGVEHPLAGDSPDAMATAWSTSGWEVDAGALDAFAAVEGAPEAVRSAVTIALQAVYRPWLEATAHALQKAVIAKGFPGYGAAAEAPLTVGDGEVLFFADGLRYDVSRALATELERRGLTVEASTRWIGMPSVTATSKHAASPVVAMMKGSADGKDFCPLSAETGKPVQKKLFDAMLAEAGYQVLSKGQTGDPRGRAYQEYGEIDHDGHALQERLAWGLDAHVRDLADRVAALLSAGWKRLRVVTDHGWLWLPGGLPAASLSAKLSDDKWGRCAVLNPHAATDPGMPTLPWRWNKGLKIVAAPGVSTFYDMSYAYAHGGLSLHECLTPDLWVSGGGGAVAVKGVVVTWKRSRCSVKIASGHAGLRLDVRRSANVASSSVVEAPKALDASGAASVLAEVDEPGEEVWAVLIDAGGTVRFSAAHAVEG